MLARIQKQLTELSEGVLLSLVEGHSQIKRGRPSEWLKKSLDFQLTGVGKGSTTLFFEAPLLKDTIGSLQLSMFAETDVSEFLNGSAVSLSEYALHKAINDEGHSHLLDKHLLRQMTSLGKALPNDQSVMEIYTGKNKTPFSLHKDNINRIKKVEENTPESVKTSISGKLDVMKHSNSRLEILTEGKRINAFPTEGMHLDQMLGHFGHDIIVTGMAHFQPSGQLNSFEIMSIREVEDKIKLPLHEFTQALFETTDLKRIAATQHYKGTAEGKIHELATQLAVEEPLEDLLRMLTP